jgi:DNA-binding GntR family transcriptional regulator
MSSRGRVYTHTRNFILSLLEKELSLGDLLPFQADLARRCHVSQATISRLLNELQKAGITVTERDGRSRLVRLPRESDRLPEPRGLSRCDEAEQDIMEMLLSGDLKPGMSLSELSLAKKFGITTAPVREAMHKLSRLGIFTKPARRKWQFVKLDPDRINDLFDLRDLLERYALKRYFAKAKPPVAPFLELMAAMENLKKSGTVSLRDLTKIDWNVHQTILKASGNSYLADSFQLAIFATQTQGYNYSDAATQRRAILSVEAHLRLLATIVAGDAPLSLKLLSQHLKTARTDLLFFRSLTSTNNEPN